MERNRVTTPAAPERAPMRGVLVALAAVAVAAALGCREPGVAASDGPTRALAALSPSSIRLVESRGRTWAVNPAAPFACFTSTAAAGGPIPYLYRRHTLEFPRGVVASARAVQPMTYRVIDGQAKVRWVLNCTIPASPRARQIVAQRFNLYPTPEDADGVNVMGCTSIEPDGDCQLAPVHAGSCGPGWSGEWPNCYKAYEPQCPALDPSCGGFGGGDPGDSGGGGSCTDCGPSTPTLSCGTVNRGETATCAVSDGTADVPSTSWRFSAPNRTPITGPDGSSWSGPGVLSGTVSAVPVAYGTVLQATLTVRARSWRFSSAVTSYSQGTGAICESRIPGYGLMAGWNMTLGNTTCVGDDNFPLQPDPRRSTTGQSVARAASGPNAGVAYVTAVSYRMDRESQMNPAVQLGGTAVTLQGTDRTRCGASASFYDYNRCRGVNMGSWHSGIWAHEGHGTTGSNGHYSAAVNAAKLAGNDPYLKLEPLVSIDGEGDTAFRDRVRTMAWDAGLRIYDASIEGSGYITGNWSGTVWIWEASTGSFRSIPMSF